MLDKFLQNNSTEMRLARTIFQGILGVLIANVDVLFAAVQIDPSMKPIIVAGVMAVLSPIMAELGKAEQK